MQPERRDFDSLTSGRVSLGRYHHRWRIIVLRIKSDMLHSDAAQRLGVLPLFRTFSRPGDQLLYSGRLWLTLRPIAKSTRG